MESAKVVAAAVIGAVAVTAGVVGVVLTTGSTGMSDGFPEPVPLSYSDDTSTDAAEVSGTVTPPPSAETAGPTRDPDAPPAFDIMGDPTLRAFNLLISGFEPGETVVVTYQGREAAQIPIGETGHGQFRGFNYHLTLPDGHREFLATGQKSGITLTIGFEV